jgi:hypothetical protein
MLQKGYKKIFVLSVFVLTMLISSTATHARELSITEKESTSTHSLEQWTSPNLSQPCSPIVTGSKPGVNGTTHPMTYDGSVSSFFDSSYSNWQFIQIDYQCVGTFSALRRYMTRDGDDVSGTRWIQGEGVSYSLDGVNWTQLTSANSNGWQIYNNYVPHAWHSVSYGWSAWLKLNTPALARYVRFNWDDDFDALNEIQVEFEELQPLDVNLHCDAGGGQFICDAIASGGSGSYSFSWQITSGNAFINQIITGGNGSTALGTCQIGKIFGIDVTVQDSLGNIDTAHRSPKCYSFLP